jgi:hypothetical protein
MTDRVILVTGLARCGSSLTCDMLHKGGVPIHPEAEGYGSCEIPNVGQTTPKYTREKILESRGKLIKVLAPADCAIPPELPYDAIYCDRNETQQAKSWANFLERVSEVRKRPNSKELRAIRDGLILDRVRSLGFLKCLPDCRLLVVRFEEILEDPHCVACRFASFLDLPLDIRAMVACVKPRKPECLETMDEPLGGGKYWIGT